MSWIDLSAANETVQANLAQRGPDQWFGSQFGWLKMLSTVPRGGAARDILQEMLRLLGYQPAAGPIVQSLVVNGQVMKVKLCMIWAGSGEFVFEQIEDDPYDCLAMFGLEPANAWLWVCPKAVARQHATRQHEGDSPWIRFVLARPPGWIDVYGGPIQAALATVSAVVGPP